jgi:p21-activated kinase 1
MESQNSTRRNKLTKKPPSHKTSHSISSEGRFDNESLLSKRSSTSLKRAPSAPQQRSAPSQQSNASNNSSPRHPPAKSNQPSPILSSGEFLPSTFSPLHKKASRTFPPSPVAGPGEGYGGGFPGYSNVGRQQQQHPQKQKLPQLRPLSSKTSEELVGAPFDGTSILNHLEATKVSGYQPPSSRRPAPPPLAHAQTSPDPRLITPTLRQSASFSGDPSMAMSLTEKAQQGVRIGENQLNGPKRYSDEGKEPKAPGVLRKKSGFSGLMSQLVGSPKKPVISAPENPVHVTHVGYDSSTGQFTVRAFLTLSRPSRLHLDWF